MGERSPRRSETVPNCSHRQISIGPQVSNLSSHRVLVHQRVSVRAGTRQTTTAPESDDSNAFFIHCSISLPYGEFIQHVPSQACFKPFSSGLKNRLHFALRASPHTSSSKRNSPLRPSNRNCGVSQLWRWDMKCTFLSSLRISPTRYSAIRLVSNLALSADKSFILLCKSTCGHRWRPWQV